MNELRGGERIAITAGRRRLHLFERSMSRHQQQLNESGSEPMVDVWRAVTAPSTKQRERFDASAPIPTVDTTHPSSPEVIREAVRLQKWRERANTRTANVKKTRTVGEVTYEYYDLGAGIPTVGTEKLWVILDHLATAGRHEVDARELAALLTRRKA